VNTDDTHMTNRLDTARTRRSSSHRTTRRLAPLIVVGLLVAACSSDEDASPATDEPVDTAAATEPSAPTDTSEQPETTDAPTTTAEEVAPTVAETTTTEAPAPTEPFDVSLATLVGAPAATNSMNGTSISPVDGNLYVASVGGTEITIHDPETGEILDRLGPDQGVNGPDDVFIADDGTVYWTDLLAGNVGMLSPDGTTTTQFVGPGVNPITMSDDGRLFVARIFLGDGLYELDPMLVADPIPLDETLAGLNAFDFGPDGLLYAPSFFTGEVVRIDVDADVIAPEVIASDVGVPSAVKFNSAGEPHVVDLAGGTVSKLDPATGETEQLLRIDATIDNIAIDADDRIFVIAGSDNQVHRIDGDEFTVLGEAGFGLPGGVAVSPDGSVWVGDFFAMRGFDETDLTNPATSFYDRFAAPGEAFAGAGSVSADGDNLIITNAFSGSVQVLDPATGEVLEDVRDVVFPVNAIRYGDRLVAAQAGGGNVVNANDLTDVLIGDLAIPFGLTTDGTTLYVGDWATGDIWAVDEAGSQVLAAGLAQPEGMAVDGDRLLVVETGEQRVIAIDLATGDISPVITGLDFSDPVVEGFLPTGMLSDVAIGPDGAIYVSDDGVNSVYRFER
jgi:sugar lactone lactonase YvrE